MGILGKALAGVVGLSSFSLGAWPLGVLCFGYLFFSLRPRRPQARAGVEGGAGGFPWRLAAGTVLAASGALALASGGTLSPIFFFSASATAFLWPSLFSPLFAEVVPVEGSVLLRSRRLPFFWLSLAEVKPGPDDFPRSMASYSGDLFVLTHPPSAYSLATCYALRRTHAEAALLGKFREASQGHRLSSFLLPLDSSTSLGLLRGRLRGSKVPSDHLVERAPALGGAIRLRSDLGRVRRIAVFDVVGEATPSVPPAPGTLVSEAPLLWEFLGALGKKVAWPRPDACSSLLDSVRASKGEPLGERIDSIEPAGERVLVRSLGGDEVQLTRAQLRAITEVYG